jgi:hypothetical protein
MGFYSSRLRQVYASPVSSLRWAPASAGQPSLFACVLSLSLLAALLVNGTPHCALINHSAKLTVIHHTFFL